MAAESDEAREESEQAYEPPEIVALGSVQELTAQPDEAFSVDDRSDLALKDRVATLVDSLARLRRIRTR